MMETSCSLYIHIPFCRHRCAYCDFVTFAGMDDLIPAYISAICKEIEFLSRNAKQRIQLHTIFLGGGTPTLLSIESIRLVLETVNLFFDCLPGLEITVEANPGTVTFPFLFELQKLGVNRISFGMQSANENDLRILERQHTVDDVVNAILWSREAGIENINLDLIFGIPNQSIQSWKNSLSFGLSLLPEHFSLYSLTLEDGTPMASWVNRGLLTKPDEDLAADMYEVAEEMLAKSGYQQYEISNWAKQDENKLPMVCKHNLQYWRYLPYIGVGVGAHGFIDEKRTINVRNPGSYIAKMKYIGEAFNFPETPATEKIHVVSEEDRMAEMVFLGLRLVGEGIDSLKFQNIFGQPLRSVYGSVIDHYVQLGLLDWDGRILKLTQKGILLGNQVFQAFI